MSTIQKEHTADQGWTINQWTGYTWHWSIDIIGYGGDMSTSLCALTEGQMPIRENCLRYYEKASPDVSMPMLQ